MTEPLSREEREFFTTAPCEPLSLRWDITVKREEQRAERAEAERDAALAALRFYAGPAWERIVIPYEDGDCWSLPVISDRGDIARAVLAAKEARDGG